MKAFISFVVVTSLILGIGFAATPAIEGLKNVVDTYTSTIQAAQSADRW